MLPIAHFRIRRYSITILNPLLPFMAVVKMSWLEQDAFNPVTMLRARRALRVYKKSLSPFRVLSIVYSLMLFVAGPLATHFGGLFYALTFVVPIHLIGLARLVSILIIQRRRWGMEWRQLASLTFECAVCPGYFANVCRKLSLGYARASADAVAFVLHQGNPRLIALASGRIDLLLADWAEGDELQPDDVQSLAIYQVHLAEASARA